MDIVYMNDAEYSDYLEHHGIQGQKWGIRRFQNPDGTLTEAGQKRYNKQVAQVERRYDTSRSPSIFDTSRNYVNMQRATYKLEKANKKVSKLEERGADLGRVHKAKENARQKRAQLAMEKAMQNAMKRMEMQNIEEGTYAHNKKVNAGREAAKRFVSIAGAYAMASISGVGVGFTTVDRREGTSLTKEQLVKATEEARRAYQQAMSI